MFYEINQNVTVFADNQIKNDEYLDAHHKDKLVKVLKTYLTKNLF